MKITSEVSSGDVDAASTSASRVELLAGNQVLDILGVCLHEAAHFQCATNMHLDLSASIPAKVTVTSASVSNWRVQASVWVIALLSTG